MSDTTVQTDFTQTFQIEGLDVRGRFVRLSTELDRVLDGHDYPPAVASMMAEMVTLTATLASALKFDGIFALQTQSDGPISLMVADVTSEGAMRGYARYDADALSGVDVGTAPVPKLLGAGHVAFTVDQGQHMERYQGITELEGATLADCAHNYFRNSEQLETVIMLHARPTEDGMAAGAVMVQRMPHKVARTVEDAEDGWRRTVALLSSLTADELLDPDLASDTLLYRLYHEDGVRVHAPQKLYQRCRCSHEKVSSTIKSFPRAEVIGDDGSVNVVCEFCKSEYDFAPGDLDQIFGAADA